MRKPVENFKVDPSKHYFIKPIIICNSCGEAHDTPVAQSLCLFDRSGVGSALTKSEMQEFLDYGELNADTVR